MKTKSYLFIAIFCISTFSFSQSKKEYIDTIAKRNHINFIAKNKNELNNIFKWYKNDIDTLIKKTKKNKSYNNAVLNIYFKDIINAYATSTKDLSFNRYFIDANTTAKTLTIGRSFRMDNWKDKNRNEIKKIRPVQKLANLLTVYAKSKFSNNFANLSSFDKSADEYNFNSDIGLGFKFTHIFNGKITPKKNNNINKFRDELVKAHIQVEINKYVSKGGLKNDIKLLSVQHDTLTTEGLKAFKKAEKSLMIKKYFEFYKAIADKELEYSKSQGFIESSSVCWYTLEGYIPLTQTKILVSKDTVNISDPAIKFNNWSLGGTFNYLHSFKDIFKKKASYKITVNLSLLNTNNFIANGTNATTFQNIIKENTNQNVNGTTSNVFIGDYKESEVVSLKLAFSSLFINNSIGLSAAYEEIIGGSEFQSKNWKLGIPISLKDKDNKPTVNFELQWRELNRKHFVGVSVGYNFGKFVK